jgi:hypothetical protein
MAVQYLSLTRHDLETKIVKRCWLDESFRREFVADPIGAFVRYLEVPAEGMPKIAVHQEEPGSWHVVLPARPANADELSEEELERIAGGGIMPAIAGTGILTAANSSAGSVIVSAREGW